MGEIAAQLGGELKTCKIICYCGNKGFELLFRHLVSCVTIGSETQHSSRRGSDAMPSLGQIEDFDLRSHNNELLAYIERLEQYFVVNSIPADDNGKHRRRAILISVIGAKAYDTLSDLCSPIDRRRLKRT